MGQVASKCIKRCTVSLLPGKDYLKHQSSNTTETTRKGVEERPSRSRDQGRMAMGKRNLSTEPLTQLLKTLWARHSEDIRRGH